jgi:hypothetical protein
MDKQYGVLIYERNHPFIEHLTFGVTGLLYCLTVSFFKVDGSYFAKLSNGQFEIIKQTLSNAAVSIDDHCADSRAPAIFYFNG